MKFKLTSPDDELPGAIVEEIVDATKQGDYVRLGAILGGLAGTAYVTLWLYDGVDIGFTLLVGAVIGGIPGAAVGALFGRVLKFVDSLIDKGDKKD